MLKHANVRDALMLLDKQYRSAQGGGPSHLLIMYSKLALLECCGWFEESFDEIVINSVRKKLRYVRDRKDLMQKIKSTHGFDYNTNFRPMLVYGVGICKVLDIEKEMDRNGDLTVLKGVLGNLNSMRRVAAHTTSNGITQTFPDPATMLSYYNTTFPIIRRYWEIVGSN
ncbi:MAG: hypothetical protein CVT77_08180 [Alphaproteobacteria bacterium HGW-Alphaproteobacteria-16]|nr:MAG: hypothetical protein CVT77_08180 [Alphaproteobacteria bacterium HGW-Alphaproteobacteria-16]